MPSRDANRAMCEVVEAFGVLVDRAHRVLRVVDAALGDPAPVRVLGIDETRRGKPC